MVDAIAFCDLEQKIGLCQFNVFGWHYKKTLSEIKINIQSCPQHSTKWHPSELLVQPWDNRHKMCVRVP